MQTATNQNGVNKTLGLFLLGLCAFYFICALGIFVLPFDVLARSFLARDFVEAMLKIYPAVERAFTHTDFTQKAALYIAYMGVVKVITLVVYMGCFLCHRAGRVAMAKAVKKQSVASRAFVSIFGIFATVLTINLDFHGTYIGYRNPRYSPEYEWVLRSPSELFWQMTIDFIFLIIVAACIFYVALQIRLLFRKRKNA
ncbi:hypothetical protein [Campylobacter showae]|uniref:hypothetical protein n=1 Tax=Campylobacter showae TaxID=204 RepID=UPI000F092B89|nr:hypothetical protein [Campylobacter showae]